jgi:hypothetical protein
MDELYKIIDHNCNEYIVKLNSSQAWLLNELCENGCIEFEKIKVIDLDLMQFCVGTFADQLKGEY